MVWREIRLKVTRTACAIALLIRGIVSAAAFFARFRNLSVHCETGICAVAVRVKLLEDMKGTWIVYG